MLKKIVTILLCVLFTGTASADFATGQITTLRVDSDLGLLRVGIGGSPFPTVDAGTSSCSNKSWGAMISMDDTRFDQIYATLVLGKGNGLLTKIKFEPDDCVSNGSAFFVRILGVIVE